MKSMRWGSLCLLLVLVGMPLAAQSPLPQRRNWQCLDDAAKQKFVDALQVLRQRSPANDSWDHPFDNSLRWYIELHNGPGEGEPSTCTHADERFLTWHRVLLHLFEGAMRKASGDATFMLPYWNWSSEPTGAHYPKEFETNPALQAQRSNDPNVRVRFSEAEILSVINNNRTWTTFAGRPGGGGAWERQRHNTMHTWVGGDEDGPMFEDTRAAEDPLFWLFHNYVDLVFDTWQRKYDYPAMGCADCPLQVMPGWKPSMVERTEQLGYVFDATICPQPDVLESVGAVASLRTLPMMMRSEEVLESVERPADKPISFDITIPRPGFEIAELRFKGAEQPSDFSYRVSVYLHPTNVAAAPADAGFRQRHRVEELTVWALSRGAGHEHAGHRMEDDLYVNASTELRYLAKTAPGSRWRVTLVIEEVMPRGKKKLTPELDRQLRQRVTFEGADLVLDRGVR